MTQKEKLLFSEITYPVPTIFLFKKLMSDPEMFNRTAVLSPENGFRKEMATQPNYTIITRHHCNTIYFFLHICFHSTDTRACSIQPLK